MTDRGEYRSIRRVLLDGPDFQKLPERARWLFVALKLNAGPTGIDVQYEDALAIQLARQTGMTASRVKAYLTELASNGWIRREGNLLWIVGHLQHDPHMSASDVKHRKSVQRHVASLPRLELVRHFVHAQPDWFPPSEGASFGLGWAIEGPSKGLRSTNNETEKEKETNLVAPEGAPVEKKQRRSVTALPYDAVFEESWAVYPKRPGNNKAAAWEQWLKRVKGGDDPLDMLTGTKAFAARCERERTEPQYVMHASRFYGKQRHFAAEWGPVAGPDPTPAEVMGKVLGVSADRIEALWAEEDQGLAIAARKGAA